MPSWLGQRPSSTFTAFAVTALLEKYSLDLVNTSFTSCMEQTSDDTLAEAEWSPAVILFGGHWSRNLGHERKKPD